MKNALLSLAAVDFSRLRALQKSSPIKPGYDILFGAIGFVVVCILIWAVFIRKREDQTARRYREHFSRSGEARSGDDAANGNGGSRRKRKRRREHRQRNPTLAETGGLPPIREHLPTDDPP